MSIEIGLSNSLPPQLPEAKSIGEQSVAENKMNDAVAIKTPNVEHATRLHSLTLPPVSKSENGTAASLNQSLALNGSSRELGGAGSKVAVKDLNVLPNVISSLHSNVINKLRHKKIGMLHYDADEAQGGSKAEVYNNEIYTPEENVNEESHFVEKFDLKQQEYLFKDINLVLVQAKQHGLIHQIRKKQRVVVVFPEALTDKGGHKACVYVLWLSSKDSGVAVQFSGVLNWSEVNRTKKWITVRGYKDRAISHSWQLRVQPAYFSRLTVSFRTGNKALLPGVWKDICVNVNEASRFWSLFQHQFSMQIAISSTPLSYWVKS